MPTPPPAPLTFYPAYCFPLSPTHNTWARLTAAQVHALCERTGFEGTYILSFSPSLSSHIYTSPPTPIPTARRAKPSNLYPARPLGQNLFFHLNHPIKWIRLVGVIVALDLYPTRWIALLDDSSGATIEITCARRAPAPAPTTRNVNAPSRADDATVRSEFEAPGKGVTAMGRDVDLSGVDVGTVVKVKGGVGSFREVRQMQLERICTSLAPLPLPLPSNLVSANKRS